MSDIPDNDKLKSSVNETPPSDVELGSSTGLNEQGGDWRVKYRPILKIVFFGVACLIVVYWLWAHEHHDNTKATTSVSAQSNTGNGAQFGQDLGTGGKPPAPNVATTTTHKKAKADKTSVLPPPNSHDANGNNGNDNGGTSNVTPVRTWVSAPVIDTSASPLSPSGFSNNEGSNTQTDPNTGLTASDRHQIAVLQAEQAQSQVNTDPVTGSTSNNRGSNDSGSKTALGGMLQGTSTPTTQASLLTGQDYLLPKGAFINAVLDTRINSSVAGMTKCTVTHNIYSVNGATVLIPKGSIVTGEYQSSVMQGQARLFVLWERLRTPSGVVVNLASPSTGTLGQSGLSGSIETHFWTRFGGAIMLSFVNDFGNFLSNMKTASTFSSTQQAAQNLATESLRNSINIPPTIIVPQGSRVAIFVARDVSFSDVYKLVKV